MANTIGTSTLSEVWRIKYFKTMLDMQLRSALVAEKICMVDRSDSRYIANPYLTGATAAIAAIAGTYAVSTATTADDTLTVSEQVTYGVHLFEFEDTLSRADLYQSFVEDMTAAVAVKADQYVINKILDDATGAYTTPAGGFSTPANVPTIFADLIAKVAGYSEMYKGLFIVLENTEVSGIVQSAAASGFSFADAALNNGYVGSYMGVDIHVVRSGTYVTATLGTLTATNSGHRLFGVKNVATYAAPRGIQYDEKKVTLKTGREIAVWANIGAKCWYQKTALLVDITLA